MKEVLLFALAYLAMLAMAFWESCAEGRHAWARRSLGWRLHLGKYVLTEYHFFVFVVFFPALLAIPLVVAGWDVRLFGMLVSAYASGMVFQDIMWFVVNPAVSLADWNPKFAEYYPWVGFGRCRVPLFYLVGIAVAIASWYFLWR